MKIPLPLTLPLGVPRPAYLSLTLAVAEDWTTVGWSIYSLDGLDLIALGALPPARHDHVPENVDVVVIALLEAAAMLANWPPFD